MTNEVLSLFVLHLGRLYPRPDGGNLNSTAKGWLGSARIDSALKSSTYTVEKHHWLLNCGTFSQNFVVSLVCKNFNLLAKVSASPALNVFFLYVLNSLQVSLLFFGLSKFFFPPTVKTVYFLLSVQVMNK